MNVCVVDDTGKTEARKWPTSLDALTAAPDHHEVLIENQHVRELDTRLAPGDRTPVHTHAWHSVLRGTNER